jgi:hypothetical protein
MDTKINLIYKLNGEGIEEGIDIFELAPVLMSFGELVNEAHRTIYPSHPDISVNVKPFKRGSFEINILMFAKDNLKDLLQFVNSDQVQEIKQLLECIGLITGGGISLVKLITFLKGKPKKVEKSGLTEYKYYSDNENSLMVNEKVHNLYQNCTIQQSIYGSLAKPLEIINVETTESYIQNDEDNSRIIYDKKIIDPIKKYIDGFVSDEIEDVVSVSTRTLFVHPKRGSYEGEPTPWSFRIAGSNATIKAHVNDKDFLNRIRAGNIRLTSTDTLKIEVSEKQKIKNSKISTTTEIVKVIDYFEGSEQLTIDSIKRNK